MARPIDTNSAAEFAKELNVCAIAEFIYDDYAEAKAQAEADNVLLEEQGVGLSAYVMQFTSDPENCWVIAFD